MITVYPHGAYYLNRKEVVLDAPGSQKPVSLGLTPDVQKKGTMAYGILSAHNQSADEDELAIRFDSLISHDITYVGIIQTARASGLTEFPVPYAMTNCHNSLCAVGGTINEDDHVFGLSCAQKYGGIYVPAHQAVIHQFAREMLAGGGRMILGSDSHTRYGALGTMAIGEGGPEIVKQLLKRTYDIHRPQVVGVYLTGELAPGVGPMDVAIALVGATFAEGTVKNKVLEFIGPGVANLSVDERIGVDVMTTETTCLSSVWETDEKVHAWLALHGREDAYKEIRPADAAYYDTWIEIDLSKVRPMIALPFHPSNAYPIAELKDNLTSILKEVEEKAKTSLGEGVDFTLTDKIRDGGLYVEQGVIGGCAGGGFENLSAAADILRGYDIGNGEFSLSLYPASQPIMMELVKNGTAADLLATGATIRTAFCGPCFGAGDVPANKGLSVRHSTRNFPNREGSKITESQIAYVALMDARSIAATARNHGRLTAADEIPVEYTHPAYHFDASLYAKRVYNGVGAPKPETEIKRGPNIKDWPEMIALTDNLMLKVVSEIHDAVTTTDELIPSGETSSYRSNPLRLAEFALSRRDPAYVGEAKAVAALESMRQAGEDPAAADEAFARAFALAGVEAGSYSIGSAIFAEKPGDGSAREQAASCQKVLGGFANLAREYATKRYRSNLINWGMLPLLVPEGELPFKKGDWLLLKDVRTAVKEGLPITTVLLSGESRQEFTLNTGDLTADEREIILDGCLINYYKR